MRRARVSLITALAVMAGGAAADGCEDRASKIVQQVFPAAILDGKDIQIGVETARLDSGIGGDPLAVICRRWPAQPDRVLVAIPLLAQGPDPEGYDLRGDLMVAVLDHASLAPLARLRLDDFIHDDAISLRRLSFDTAPYRLIGGRLAFGIRAETASMSQPNPFHETRLWLFDQAPDSSALTPVLTEMVVAQFGGEWDTQCAGEFQRMTRILHLPGSIHAGAADIQVATTAVTEQAEMRDGARAEWVADRQVTTEVLVFDRAEYPVPGALIQ